MQTIQQEIDERTNLTSSNKLELLLFRLGDHRGADPADLPLEPGAVPRLTVAADMSVTFVSPPDDAA